MLLVCAVLALGVCMELAPSAIAVSGEGIVRVIRTVLRAPGSYAIQLAENHEHVVCNGGTMGRLYKRYLAERVGLAATVLPSTSPTNAAWRLSRLVERWGEVTVARGVVVPDGGARLFSEEGVLEKALSGSPFQEYGNLYLQIMASTTFKIW